MGGGKLLLLENQTARAEAAVTADVVPQVLPRVKAFGQVSSRRRRPSRRNSSRGRARPLIIHGVGEGAADGTKATTRLTSSTRG